MPRTRVNKTVEIAHTPARKTSMMLSHAAASIVAERALPGESMSSTISRLIEQLDTVERILGRLGGGLTSR